MNVVVMAIYESKAVAMATYDSCCDAYHDNCSDGYLRKLLPWYFVSAFSARNICVHRPIFSLGRADSEIQVTQLMFIQVASLPISCQVFFGEACLSTWARAKYCLLVSISLPPRGQCITDHTMWVRFFPTCPYLLDLFGGDASLNTGARAKCLSDFFAVGGPLRRNHQAAVSVGFEPSSTPSQIT